MSRAVRMVPADWQHPKYPADHYQRAGKYIPLQTGDYSADATEWDMGREHWLRGEVRNYSGPEKWRPRDPDKTGRYTEYAGPRPSPDDYMPNWPKAERTHSMMYETTSEGTPISPAFETPEELARWLTDNKASAFGGSGATYEQWLSTAKRGWAPSAVMTDGQFMSGVEALSEAPHHD